MVCYEIITLHKVYNGENIGKNKMAFMIIHNNRKPNVEKLVEVQNALKKNQDKEICQTLIKLAKKCWSKNPDSRPKASEGMFFSFHR